MTEPSRTETISVGEASHVIVRACVKCRSPRQVGVPCSTCGHCAPPEVTNLGVTSATYENRFRRAWWSLAGERLAKRRIGRANRRAMQLRTDGTSGSEPS